MILRDRVEDVRVTNNVFWSATYGVSLKMDSRRAKRLVVESNTFYQVDHWLRCDLASLDQEDVYFRFNLALDCFGVGGADLSSVAAQWFTSNWWEILPSDVQSNRKQAELIARWTDDTRLQRDPNSADFLVPSPDSPLRSITDAARGEPPCIGSCGAAGQWLIDRSSP
jgi:hypothetical protein